MLPTTSGMSGRVLIIDPDPNEIGAASAPLRDPEARPEVPELERRLRAMLDELPEVDVDDGPPDAETVAVATTRWAHDDAPDRDAS